MDKKNDILAAALKLFVLFGFHGTPTSKIAKEAGVATGTLFHHFNTKDDLVVALYNSLKEELNGFLSSQLSDEDSIEKKFRLSLFYSIKWALDNSDAFYFIQQFQFSPHLSLIPPDEIEKQTQMHTDVLADAISSQLIKPRPPALILALISSQISGIQHYLTAVSLTKEEENRVIEDGIDMLFTMLRT